MQRQRRDNQHGRGAEDEHPKKFVNKAQRPSVDVCVICQFVEQLLQARQLQQEPTGNENESRTNQQEAEMSML